MTSMTQNRALSFVHPRVNTSTNHNIGFKSRVEGGHHYLDFRLILRSCTSEYFYSVKITEQLRLKKNPTMMMWIIRKVLVD